MKNILLLSLILMVFSCQQTKNDNPKNEDKLAELTTFEKNLLNDTILLNYWIGMSEAEFKEHTNKLVETNKLKVNSDNTLVYEMTFGESSGDKGEAVFSPFYFKNRLYKLGVAVTPVKSIVSLNLNLELAQANIVLLFSKKYGYKSVEEKSLRSTIDYIWTYGKKKIKIIQGINDVRIFYIDIDVEKEMEEKEKIKKQNEVKNTIDDI